MKQALTDIRIFDSLTARLSGSQSPMSGRRRTCSLEGELQTEFCGSTTIFVRDCSSGKSFRDFGLIWSR